MAKMFYNLQEAASRLHVSEDEIRKMVDEGKLQQFRDREKLMFKREQVDELASQERTVAEDEEGTDALSLDDTVESLASKTDKIELVTDEEGGASGEGTALNLELDEPTEVREETDAIVLDEATEELTEAESGAMSLSDTTGIALSPVDTGASTAPLGTESQPQSIDGLEIEDLTVEEEPQAPRPAKPPGKKGAGTAAGATGISVFDSQEIEPVDSMARTQVSRAFAAETEEEELNLESVGSGSGLLDLTREADDTSLGAVELLDDIAPAGETAPGGTVGGTIGGSVAGSATGIFEGAAEAEAAAATSGTISPEAEAPAEEEEEAPALAVTRYAAAEGVDPVGDSWSGATMLGVFAVLVVGAIIALTTLQGQFLEITRQFTTLANRNDPQQSLYIMVGGLLAVNILLLVIGLVFGKMRAKRA